MQLSLIADDRDLLRVACVGQITQDDFEPGADPMAAVLGPEGFSRKVLLNLEKATYIDSSGISWLLICHKHFVQGKGQLIVHSVPPLVSQVLQLIRLPSIMHFAPNEPAARALALGEKP